MLANVIHLELAKQRKEFVAVMAILLGVILCFLIESTFRQRNVTEVLRDVIGFLASGAIVVLAFGGASSAKQLRSELNRSAEEPLPISPTHRVFGAYVTNLIYLLSGCAILFVLFLISGSDEIFEWFNPVLGFAMVLHFHLLAFVFTYWISQIAMSIVLAGLVVAAERILVNYSAHLKVLMGKYLWTFDEALYSLATGIFFLMSLLGAVVALCLIASRIELERPTRWMKGLTAFAAIVAGVVFLLIHIGSTSYRYQNKLIPMDSYVTQVLITEPTPIRNLGGIFGTEVGGLVRINPKSRQIVREGSPKLFLSSIDQYIRSIFIDEQENLWVLIHEIRDDEKYEIWKAPPEKSLQLYSQFQSSSVVPWYLFVRSNEPVLYGRKEFTRVTPGGIEDWKSIPVADPSFSFLGSIHDHVLSDKTKAGLTAELSSNKNSLTRRLEYGSSQEWSLPGQARVPEYSGRTITPAFYKDNLPYFAVPVENNKAITIVLCQPDGSITNIWDTTWPAQNHIGYRTAPGGGIGFILRNEKTHEPIEARILGADGTAFPPVKLKTEKFGYYIDLLKIHGSHLWLFLDYKLQKIDLATGKILYTSELIGNTQLNVFQSVYTNRTKEGVYFVRDERIKLIDWDGKTHDLGPASLN